MRLLVLGLLVATALQATPFRLDPGEYRWLSFTVKKIPTAVDCKFRVLSGRATVHMEVLTMPEFRRFYRGQDHEMFASSPNGQKGEIRQMVDERGEFAVIVRNEDRAPTAIVDLEVSTDVNPSPESMARVLPPGRRLAVILISFGIFFGLVMWSGWRLWRAAGAGNR
jgi:hypothetical protein